MPVSAPHSWNNLTNKPNTVAGFGITDMASQTCGAVPFSGVTGKPTTLTGYGITDEKCKAWVNFNGTGVVAIRASFNVSSITDNGVGDYTVNFTTAMVDANYAVVGNIGQGTYGSIEPQFTTAQTTTAVRLQARNGSNTAVDPQTVNISTFR